MSTITVLPTSEFGALAKAQLGDDAAGLTSAQAIEMVVRNVFRTPARQSERQKIDLSTEQAALASAALAVKAEADAREAATVTANANAETLLAGIKVS